MGAVAGTQNSDVSRGIVDSRTDRLRSGRGGVRARGKAFPTKENFHAAFGKLCETSVNEKVSHGLE